MIKISLDKVPRCLRVCWIADKLLRDRGMPGVIPALWSKRGWGKSSVVRQSTPKGYGYYKYQLSTKEAIELGGLMRPVEVKGKHHVEYIMPRTLPFDSEEKCVVNFDEVDRVQDVSVHNAFMQLIGDEREINGHRLSPNAQLVLTGNGATDIGTTSLTDALAGRTLHLYIETEDDSALNAWTSWAQANELPPRLQSFARYQNEVWTGAKARGELEEMGSCTPRTAVAADFVYEVCKTKVNFETDDILLPLVAGSVGTAEARKMLGWYKVCEECPTVQEITSTPRTCKLPSGNLGLFYALGLTLARYAKALDNGKIDAIAQYIARWPMEQSRAAFTQVLKEQPKAATAQAYLAWEKSRQ